MKAAQNPETRADAAIDGDVLLAPARASALDPGGRFLERPLEHGLAAALVARDDRRPIVVRGLAAIGKTALLARVTRRLLGRGVAFENLAWAGAGIAEFEPWLRARLERCGARPHRPLVLLIDELAAQPGAAESVLRITGEGACLRVAAGDSLGAAVPDGWRPVALGPRTADELVDDPGRPAPVRDRSLREVLLAATQKSRFVERRAALRARRSLVLGGGFPEALTQALTRAPEQRAEGGEVEGRGGLRGSIHGWMVERVIEPGVRDLAGASGLGLERVAGVCRELALRRGRPLRTRELSAALALGEQELGELLERLEARGWIARSSAYGRRGMAAEFAVHWSCVALRRAAVRCCEKMALPERSASQLPFGPSPEGAAVPIGPSADATGAQKALTECAARIDAHSLCGRFGDRPPETPGPGAAQSPRLIEELDGLLSAHAVAVARARGRRLQHIAGPGALSLVLDDGGGPVALLCAEDGAGPRGLLRRAIAKRPALAGGCFLVLRDPLPMSVPPGEDGIGSLSLDSALLLLGRRVRALQLRQDDPLAAGVQQLAF